MTEDAATPVPRSRRLLFTIIAVSLPLLLLAGAELVLSGVDAVPRIPLFIQNPQHPEYSLANPAVIGRFFSRPDAAPTVSIDTGFFSTRRAPDTLRLVVQGGSSAAGFPYGYAASLAGMLEQRLRREMPERRVEVVSTAMSAVNSYALLDFADEIVATEPDAVLIYAGHNEFLGILGVGSAYSSSRSATITRFIMRLRRLHLYRGLERLLSPAGGQGASASQGEGTLMARIAAERRIPLGSALYEKGLLQFEGNLQRLIRRYRNAGIPVFLATLVSNERDQPPFISSPDDTNTVAAQPVETSAGDTAPTLAVLEAAVQRGEADAAYLLGQTRLGMGDADGARQAFVTARDLDQLRFRAPTAMNDIIRRAAAAEGVTLVDVEAAFRAASEDGIVGRELMLEHLHPNVDGYFLMASAFHAALTGPGGIVEVPSAVSDAVARDEIPVSAVDRLFGDYKLQRLVNDWPFTKETQEPVLPPPRSTEERLARELYDQTADWIQVHRRLKDWYRRQRDESEFLRVALILADAFPYNAAYQYDAGVALATAGRHLQAVRYLYQADGARPGHVPTLVALGRACLAAGLRDRARSAFSKALEQQPGNAAAQRGLREASG